MDSSVFVFPGQGSQSKGMGKKLYEEYESAREIFETGNEILGYNIAKIMFEGPEEELKKTIHCQPAILITNLAYFSVLEKKVGCSLTLGHSVGEYSALVASKALLLEDAIRLVQKRARYMNDCIPKEEGFEGISNMAAILTENHDLVYKACEKCSNDGSIAGVGNINSPSQIVISGHKSAIHSVVQYLINEGINRKIIRYLAVEGPYHSEIMRPAAEKIKEELEKIEMKKPEIPYIANVSAEPAFGPERIKENLVGQIPKTVLWRQSIEKAINMGHKRFIESGWGDVQTNILRRNYKEAEVLLRDQ